MGLPQAFLDLVDAPAVARDGLRPRAELLPQRDRRGIHQLRAPELRHVGKFPLLFLQRFLQPGQGIGQFAHQPDRRDPQRGGIDVVGGLSAVRVVERMDPRVIARLSAQPENGQVREHFVDVHVRRRARPALQGVHGKRRGVAPFRHLVARGGEGVGDVRRQRAEFAVGQRAGFLHDREGADQFRPRRAAAGAEIPQRPLHVDPVQGVGGHLHGAQAVAFRPHGKAL